jgi:hypothetical protein
MTSTLVGSIIYALEVAMSLELTSTAFSNNGTVPARHTCEGSDTSPPLRWSGAPVGTRSFAVVCSDPDAPAGTWYHWAIYDIPPDVAGLPEHYPPEGRGDIRQAINDFGRKGYGGPCPPRGHGTHHYHFKLYALKVERLPLEGSPPCREVERSAKSHALGEAELVGLFSR